MTPELERQMQEMAEAYATGNHRTSVPDTYDQRAFKTGFTVAYELMAGEIERLKSDRLNLVNVLPDGTIRPVFQDAELAEAKLEADRLKLQLSIYRADGPLMVTIRNQRAEIEKLNSKLQEDRDC